MDPLTGNLIIRTNSDPRISYLPEAEAGLDSGMFYQRYDVLAEEIDEDMAKGLKEHLDGLLIFAGLFAGVNSAFLALTLPLLSADPVDDTNTLLLQNNALLLYLALGRNDTLPSSPTLPSSTFTPSYNIITINVLFSLSLAFALISAFVAVLGRQWLIYYRMRSGGGPDRERWEQLKRYLGAERWHLQFILDDILPSLLQIGLIIFCVSFILYIHMLHPTASHIVGIPLYVGLAMVFLSAICILWDKFCPFQSPLSHFFLGCASAFRRCLGSRPNEDEEGQVHLQVTAVERAISTSDDDLTLLYAAAHVITLDSGSSLGQLWNDGVFQRRMLELCTRSRERMSHLKLRDQTSTVAGAAARLFRAALAHVFLSLRNEATAESLHSLTKLCQSDGDTFSIWLIPTEEIQHTSPALVRASLAFSLLRSHVIAYHINSLSGYLASYSDPLAGAGWDSLALMALAINLLVPDGQSPKKPDHYVQLDRLKQVYSGYVV
ncbi:hypothetical protein FRC04_005079 [Tulasnella sp. 424]|nr:hypothetical protein FRC04_005079 [Tulasnella sp. 424]KAG8963222.1 hypothetical protein FRC05_004902 [Tulasnella sp. 425]